MGLFSGKRENTSNNLKTINELNIDLKVINNITSNDLFVRKCGIGICFHLEKNVFFLKKLFTKTTVLVETKIDNDGRFFNISIEEFYNFYNILMDCLQIFYDNNIIKKRSYTIKPKRTIDEDELCCICEETKPNMMLDCYHFFCEKCIETWLFKKNKSCPLCRMEINIKNDENVEETSLKKQSWSIISEGDVNKKETIDDLNSIFNNALNKLINK